ncbi:CHC2 zinc finger domain-containing protein [Streptomyces sp. NPDC047821]|uniref:CHC2 zinc finger domain-containing protein n=1 Tax=Streptomyces sp. NPDC047821 TaxID=3365488 RepID=UPI0037151199
MGSYGSVSRRRGAEGTAPVIPIAPVLQHYSVELNNVRWGEEQVCCPVHGDRRPSMRVNAEKGVFFCHSCGAKGTAINLIMLMETCDRADAEQRAEAILRASGIDLPERSRGRYQRPGVSGEPGVRASGRKYVPPGRR